MTTYSRHWSLRKIKKFVSRGLTGILMESYRVIWNNKEVGHLINPMPDMWYLEGDWRSNETSDSVKFETLLKSIDARQVMTDLSKGLEIILRSTEMAELDAAVISLDNDKLFVRLVTKN